MNPATGIDADKTRFKKLDLSLSPNTDRNFLPKLRKYCHEVMGGNCYRLPVALQVTAREVMTFLGDQHHFRLHHTISRDRCPEKW